VRAYVLSQYSNSNKEKKEKYCDPRCCIHDKLECLSFLFLLEKEKIRFIEYDECGDERGNNKKHKKWGRPKKHLRYGEPCVCMNHEEPNERTVCCNPEPLKKSKKRKRNIFLMEYFHRFIIYHKTLLSWNLYTLKKYPAMTPMLVLAIFKSLN